MVLKTSELSEFVPPEIWEDIKGEDRAHIGPNLSTNICACTGREIQKLVLNLPDQDEQIADYPEIFDEHGQVLSEKVISTDVIEEKISDPDEDPVKKIIVETFLTEGDVGLQDLVVNKQEKTIVLNHKKMRPVDCPRKMKLKTI